MIDLLSAKKNKFYSISKISPKASLKIKRRLIELGFTQNVKIKVKYRSLLGQAYLVELRGYTLSIRKDIAGFVLVDER